MSLQDQGLRSNVSRRRQRLAVRGEIIRFELSNEFIRGRQFLDVRNADHTGMKPVESLAHSCSIKCTKSRARKHADAQCPGDFLVREFKLRPHQGRRSFALWQFCDGRLQHNQRVFGLCLLIWRRRDILRAVQAPLNRIGEHDL